jgi:large subunit ribosomal protein L25
MKRFKLTVEKRKLVGKKIKNLRKEGILPANIYGKGIKSLAVQLPYKEFEKVYKEAGETGVVDVTVDNEIRPSLIHNIHQDYQNHKVLHAEFFQVNLKEKVTTMVKIVTVGEPKAVTDKIGLLLQPLSEVEVEALPTDLPENIEVNVESLAEVDSQITVGDVKPPSGVTILTDASQVVVSIGPLVSKEAEEQAAAEEAAAEAASEAGGDTKGEEGKEKTEEAEKTEADKDKSESETKPKTDAPENDKKEPKESK